MRNKQRVRIVSEPVESAVSLTEDKLTVPFLTDDRVRNSSALFPFLMTTAALAAFRPSDTCGC